MRAARVVALAALLVGAAGGCDGCKKKSKPAPAATAVEPDRDEPDRGPRTGPVDRRPPRPPEPGGRRVRAEPIAVADATPMMPKLDARTLAEPAAAPSGTQVRFTYCVDAESLDAAGASVVRSLEADGWTKVTARPPADASASPRFGIAAEKGDHRLSVTVQAVRRTGCDATVNQFFTVASLSKLGEAAPPAP